MVSSLETERKDHAPKRPTPGPRLSRKMRIVAGGLAALVVAVVAWSNVVSPPPRDEDAFAVTLRQFYMLPNGEIPAADLNSALTEGDLACDWLSTQVVTLDPNIPVLAMNFVQLLNVRPMKGQLEPKEPFGDIAYVKDFLVATAAFDSLCSPTAEAWKDIPQRLVQGSYGGGGD